MKPRPGSGTSLAAAALALAGVLAGAPAAAQVSAEDSALAETLFREAKKLMAEHAYAEACPKLVESQRLDPGGGTLLTLALCHEAEGKTASAWAEFHDAAGIAQRDGRTDCVAIAAARAAALEPRLAWIRVRVSPALADTPGIDVRCDDLAMARAVWGVAVPMDPGRHRVVATATGKKRWSRDVDVEREGASVEVDVGPLEDAPAPPPPPPPPGPAPEPPQAPPPRFLDARGISGIAVAGTGLVLVGVSIYLGVRASSDQRQADKICPNTTCTSASAVGLNGDAKTSADLSTAGFVAGGAALATGALLLLWPRTQRAPARLVVAPVAAARSAGLVAAGAW